MKIYHLIKKLLAHVCVISSISYITLLVLDWYNPYMDFAGHGQGVLYLLCLGAFLLGGMEIYGPGGKKR